MDLLQSMPASTAAEVTLQLLLQSSHKWVFKVPAVLQPRLINTGLMRGQEQEPDLAGIAEDDIGAAAELEALKQAEVSPDEALEEEYDEEEVRLSDPRPNQIALLISAYPETLLGVPLPDNTCRQHEICRDLSTNVCRTLV